MKAQHDASIAATEALLLRTAAALEYPATPPLAGGVESRIRLEVERRSDWWRTPMPRLAGAAAAALLAVFGVTLAVPASRTALAEFFGIDGVTVEVEPSQTALPTITVDEIGRETTLSEAERLLGFSVSLPAGEEPDEAYLIEDEAGVAAVILVYADEGFELWETERLEFGKAVRTTAFVHEVEVGGDPGVWIEPGHTAYLEEAGLRTFARGVERGVLLWEADGKTYRLETAASQQEAIEIAESVE